MATRWGIASAGKISSDFAAALQVYPPTQHRIVAVAARNIHDAKTFAHKYKGEKAYGSYEELAKDPDVEVVYIGSINTQHLTLATLMMKAGKHVLCEKPLCVNVKETKQLLKVAKEQKVFLMEAIWSRYFPSYQEMMKRISAGEIGEVYHVMASMGKPLAHVDRVSQKIYAGGVTLDLGVYLVQLTSLIMGGQKPLKVTAGGHLNAEGVDESIGVTVTYPGGRIASFTATSRVELPCEAFIVGTKGTIKMSAPMWCPTSLDTPSGPFSATLPQTGETFNFDNSQGLMYEAEEVRKCLKKGLLESPGLPHSESLIIAETLQEIRTQVGTTYQQD